MNKKITSYTDLLAEKQNLEALFEVQKSLLKMTVDEIKSDLDPAFNAIEFLRKLAFRNADNPLLQSGINLLINLLSDKLQGKNPGFLRSTIVPYVLKNYASNLLAGHADDLIHYLVSLFQNEKEPVAED